MILKCINETTNAMLDYYKKLVELEGAITAFNHDLVVAKLNDIHVLRIRQITIQTNLSKAFTEKTGLQWNNENFISYCESSFELTTAYLNLKDYINECLKLSNEVIDCNNESMKVAVKFLGNENTHNSQIDKISKWGKKAKR